MKEKQNENLEHLLDRFKEIFRNELGTMKNEKTKNFLKLNSIHKFLKAIYCLMHLNKELK